jgi:hypothetical protein
MEQRSCQQTKNVKFPIHSGVVGCHLAGRVADHVHVLAPANCVGSQVAL